MTPESIRRKLESLSARHSQAVSQVSREKQSLRESLSYLRACEEAQGIIQAVAQQVQETAHSQIASVVSRCLAAVFGEDAYSFRILFVRKRGRTEAQLVFERDGLVLNDPASQGGVGQIDVAALALRLACLLLTKPQRRKILVLDEPMKNVNGEVYQSRVGELILNLASEMGIQFVIVSDDEWLEIGKVVELE